MTSGTLLRNEAAYIASRIEEVESAHAALMLAAERWWYSLPAEARRKDTSLAEVWAEFDKLCDQHMDGVGWGEFCGGVG